MAVWACFLLVLVTASGVHSQNPKAPDDNDVDILRSSLLYPYSSDDYQDWITDNTPEVPFQLPFKLPFLGLGIDYAWISLNGYISFNTDTKVSFPLQFPVDEWPYKPDPTFLGPYVTPSVLGISNSPAAEPGVYLSVYSNIGANQLQSEINLKAAVQEDVRNASFDLFYEPKHVIIITWRNITSRNNTDKRRTNTFQVVLTTDGKNTYALFNYEHMASTGHAPPPFIGFNIGNNSGGVEYRPYSRNSQLPFILKTGEGNRFRGRHAFRLDGRNIQAFACNVAPGPGIERLYLSAIRGDIRGGDEVNVTGPCFDSRHPIHVSFNNHSVQCAFRSRHRASCITPALAATGLVDVQFKNETTQHIFKSNLYSQDSLMSQAGVATILVDEEKYGSPIHLAWDRKVFQASQQQILNITLIGFREDRNGRLSIQHVKDIAVVKNDNGAYRIPVDHLYSEKDGDLDDIQLGMIQIYPAFRNPGEPSNYKRTLWSKPLPLDWFFRRYWIQRLGKDWARQMCNQWLVRDQQLPDFQTTLPTCPCTKQQINADKGRFVRDIECNSEECGNFDNWSNLNCFRSGQPILSGSGQYCCYDENEELISNQEYRQTGFPSRIHPHASPLSDTVDFPWLSHWLRDKLGGLTCCEWLGNKSEGCNQFMRQRRQNECSLYQAPNSSMIFGDPHIITFDNLQYTFNAKGEFTLLTAQDQDNTKLEIQGRFQQILGDNKIMALNATQLTSVVVKESNSPVVEVQIPPLTYSARANSAPRILINGVEIDAYFLATFNNLRPFQGVTFYRGLSSTIAMFPSGAGVEFFARQPPNPMAAIVYLPPSFKNSTSGLLGTWSGSLSDDLTPPADLHLPPLIPNASDRDIYDTFGLNWAVTDEGIPGRPGSKSLFHYEHGRSSDFYTDKNFRPVFWNDIHNDTDIEEDIKEVCNLNLQCRYDFAVTRNGEFARQTQSHLARFTQTKDIFKEVILCPSLPNPDHGKKDTNSRIVGTKVTFSCEDGFHLEGESTRYCLPSGKWSSVEAGETKCVPDGIS